MLLPLGVAVDDRRRSTRNKESSMYIQKKSLVLLAAGLAVGLSVGLLATRNASPQFQFPATLLNATATHGGTTMAVASGPVGDSGEGFFILDFITGELTGYTFYRRTNQIGGKFTHNVVEDLGVEEGKQPQYLMVTGQVNFRTQGNVGPAASVICVADANTGKFVFYAPRWDNQMESRGRPQEQTLVKVFEGNAREELETE